MSSLSFPQQLNCKTKTCRIAEESALMKCSSPVSWWKSGSDDSPCVFFPLCFSLLVCWCDWCSRQHRCCYEDHQPGSRADRKCQNNAEILAAFLMDIRPHMHTRVTPTYVCKSGICFGAPFLQHVFVYEGKAWLGQLPSSNGGSPLYPSWPTVFPFCLHRGELLWRLHSRGTCSAIRPPKWSHP